MFVYTHSKFQNMKFILSVFHKFFKKRTQKFFHAKIENQIDELIKSGSLQTFHVRQQQNKFCKCSQNCNLSALLNFASLIDKFCYYFGHIWPNFNILWIICLIVSGWRRNLFTSTNLTLDPNTSIKSRVFSFLRVKFIFLYFLRFHFRLSKSRVLWYFSRAPQLFICIWIL